MVQNTDEEAILNKIFKIEGLKPKKTYRIESLGLSFTFQALSEQKVESMRNKYNAQTMEHGERIHGFNRAVVAAATIAIDGDEKITFAHPGLMQKFKASSPEHVVKRVLQPGHIIELTDKVLMLSGFYEKVSEVEVKNSLKTGN